MKRRQDNEKEQILKRILINLFFLFLIIFFLFSFNNFRFPSKQLSVEKVPLLSINQEAAVQRFSKSLKFKTISYDDADQLVSREFVGFHRFLETSFPNVHAKLQREIVADYSVLYQWQGQRPDLKPILLMAHFDVVPAENIEQIPWEYDPYGGQVADGYIWGRGALDDKVSVMAILEAIEHLIDQKFVPQRTIYLAFSHDEEVPRKHGALNMSDWFRQRNISFEYILDEGGVVAKDFLPEIKNQIALIGIAEKGYLTVDLVVEGEGGHSSIPPKETTVGILSRAIGKLESNPPPAKMTEPVIKMFEYLGPHMPIFKKMVFANMLLTSGMITQVLSSKKFTNSFVRTTVAPTMLKASPKQNVLPKQAIATINFRLLPGDSTDKILKYVKRTIDDQRVRVVASKGSLEPTKVSSTESWAFQTIQESIGQVDPDIVVAPWMLVASTDSAYYQDLSDDIYRFVFLRSAISDLKRIHGVNERIGLDDYMEAIHFYNLLILNSSK